LKQADVEACMKQRSGIEWVAYGHRAQESVERQAMLRHIGGLDAKNHRVYPLTFWSGKQVFRYLRERNIPLSPEYRFLKRSFGCFWGENLSPIRDRYPNDYKKIIRVFPEAEAELVRWESNNERDQGSI